MYVSSNTCSSVPAPPGQASEELTLICLNTHSHGEVTLCSPVSGGIRQAWGSAQHCLGTLEKLSDPSMTWFPSEKQGEATLRTLEPPTLEMSNVCELRFSACALWVTTECSCIPQLPVCNSSGQLYHGSLGNLTWDTFPSFSLWSFALRSCKAG